ncbi:MAG TPA: hypothetical protein VI072_28130 [Polyangiaceae bacterium]
MNETRRLLLVALAACALCACGGSEKPGARSGADEPVSEAASSDSAHDGAGDVADAKPRLPSCEDGTCFACGDTICLTGFYCDTNAPGGPACSWLPACTARGMCSCLKRELGNTCSCEEKSGGAHVTCS